MTRLILGIIFLTIFVLPIVSYLTILAGGGSTQDPDWFSSLYVWFILFGVPGIIFTLLGRNAIRSKEKITSEAYKLLQEDGRVDTQKIVNDLGIRSYTVQKILDELKRKHRLPTDAQIV